MSIDTLKELREGFRVMCRVQVAEGDKVAIGMVHAIDKRCVEIWWADGTSSLIWFRHCEGGRDTRHQFLFPHRRVVA